MKPKPGSGWTVADIPDQTGRRALITGANSGIGFFTALELARKGAYVLLACRDRTKGEAALARLRSQLSNASAEVVLLDLASLNSVHECARQELRQPVPLDLLINNAGVYAPPQRRETEEGFELQFGTNVLGHFALTALLLPALQRAASQSKSQARVITLASIAHKRAQLRFEDLQFTTGYKPMAAYQQSKLADLIFAFELERRLQVTSPGILSIAAHPGVANTALFTKGEFSSFETLARHTVGKLIDFLLNSEPGGAIPTLFAATSPQAIGGGYYGPQGFQEMRGNDVGIAKVAPQALNLDAAARLWDECERLTGLHLL